MSEVPSADCAAMLATPLSERDALLARAERAERMHAQAFDLGIAHQAARQRAEAEAAKLREALRLYEAAKDGIAADSYDGIEPRYALMLQEASALARAALDIARCAAPATAAGPG